MARHGNEWPSASASCTPATSSSNTPRQIVTVQEAARQPNLRLPQILEMFVEGYADRPALGWRAALADHRSRDRPHDRAAASRFDTLTYRELWANVGAIASAWRHDAANPVTPGDFVATVGFASAEYLTVDLVCGYLGLVAVPLQHNAAASRLQPIIAEVEPRVLAAGAGYLDLAVEAALGSTSLRRLVVFDYQPKIDDQREALERARAKLAAAGMAVTIETLDEVIERGRALPPEPMYTGDTDERLAMIMYTSGSTGLPKGAMYTERMVCKIWTNALMPDFADTPVFNVNFMPLNHLGGRIPLSTSFQAGGTSYFVPESDLSTLFEDWNLVRPTEMGLVPGWPKCCTSATKAPSIGESPSAQTPWPPRRTRKPSCATRSLVGASSPPSAARRHWQRR